MILCHLLLFEITKNDIYKYTSEFKLHYVFLTFVNFSINKHISWMANTHTTHTIMTLQFQITVAATQTVELCSANKQPLARCFLLIIIMLHKKRLHLLCKDIAFTVCLFVFSTCFELHYHVVASSAIGHWYVYIRYQSSKY